jgi:uncharacterized membrane-anchored protein YhcB (DUF1043 family)
MRGKAALCGMINFPELYTMEVQQNTTLPSGYEGLTFEKVWALFQETDRKFQEQRQEQRQEAERRFQEQRQEAERRFQENEKLLRQNQKMMSDLGRKFGKIIEHMFIPNLEEKFNALGYEFGKSSTNVLIGNKEHNIYAEIDVLLENGDCALAVEVKTQANIDDVREHMDRMRKLRQYFALHHDTRRLYGALAAALIPGNVHDFALKQGFYVVQQSGDTVSVEAPQGEPRAW